MQVGEVAFHVQGDIGGTGISRFRFVRQDSAAITGTDCNAVAAAAKSMLNALVAYIPTSVTWTCQGQVNVYDVASGLVQGPLVVGSLPATVTGTGGVQFGAGLGARINWKTSTLSGRRLLKGATFVVPFASAGYAASGGILAAALTAGNTAAGGYLTALTTAALYPVIWHRPPKGTHTGGVTGIVYAGIMSAVPAGLRSRRS